MAKFEPDRREFDKFISRILGRCSKCGAFTCIAASVGKACRDVITGGRCDGMFLPLNEDERRVANLLRKDGAR